MKMEKWYSPVAMFSFIWLAVISFYMLRIFPIYDITIRCKVIITLGILSFLIGARGGGYTLGKKKLGFTSDFEVNASLADSNMSRKVYFLSYICIALLFVEALQSIVLLSKGISFEDITVSKDYFIGGTLWTFFQVYFSGPFSTALMPIGALNFVKTNGDKKIALLSMIVTILKVLHHGGRASIVHYVLYLVLFKAILGRKITIKQSTKIWMSLVTVVALIAFVIVSINRGVKEFGQSAYLYLCGCIPDFDLRIDNLLDNSCMYGTASLYGYFSPIMFLYKGVFNSYPHFFIELQNIVNVENTIQIGPGVEYGYNAFVTPFYYFFTDAREFGVVVGGFIWGLVSQNAYRRIKNSFNDRNVIIYSLFFYQIVFSMVRFHFAIYQYALAFIYVSIIYKLSTSYHTNEYTRKVYYG